MNDLEILGVVEKQEEAFVFEQFTHEDAWKLGNIIVEVARRRKFSPAISIRLMSGYTVFQYGFDNTGLDHENWMLRKLASCEVKMMSTMRLDYILKTCELDMRDAWFMDPMEYSTCPGAFPIKVKGVGMIGTILVSGISVLTDHDLIAEALNEYFGTEVERIVEDI
ncbi:MAG: heme-binding protein [Lachnospiraceae bacterium]